MTSYKIKQFRQIPPFKSLILLVFVFSINFCFGQDKIINEIKSYNEEGNYQKSVKQIKKYQDKKYDTLNYNYLIALADYYCIPKNNEYSPFKAISILKDINCAKISAEILGIYFKDNQDCNLVLKNKNDRYVSLYFEIIYNSNDLDTLKSFYTDFKSYKEYKDKIYQKIALISFNKAKQTNSKSELLKFQKEFANTSFAAEAIALIEEIDYESAKSTNTIESYSVFLKNYPQTNKRDIILPKLEALKWQESVTLNTKNSFQTFINDFPNSTKLQEAKMMLSKFVDVCNLGQTASFTSLSNGVQCIRPTKNGKIVRELCLKAISHNGKVALAVNQTNDVMAASEKIAYIIDLNDGEIIYNFNFEKLMNCIFSNDDSKLYYYNNNYVSQLDLKTFEITNLFHDEVNESSYGPQYLGLENESLHFSKYKYSTPQKEIIHYSYNINSKKLNYEVFNEPDYSLRGDLNKEFDSFNGSTEEKLLKLKLIHGNDLFIKPLSKYQSNEFLVLSYPFIYILKNGVFKPIGNVAIWKTDKLTQNKNIVEYSPNSNYYQSVQLTIDNRILLVYDDKLFILPLGDEEGLFQNNMIQKNQIDPFTIESKDRFVFVGINEETGKLYYQYEYARGNGNEEIFCVNYRDGKFYKKDSLIEKQLKTLISEIDNNLNNYLSAKINKISIKNQSLENDSEKYFRNRNAYIDIHNNFIALQDSLINGLNYALKRSIKVHKYEAFKVFLETNYNIDSESWRLVFENPYGGKNFSIIYNQLKPDAKNSLIKKFSNISIQVSYCINLLSYSYEPFLVEINDLDKKTSQKIFTPLKDYSLLQNITLTNSSLSLNYPGQFLDENISRYFINNGKPKYYFNQKKTYYNSYSKVNAAIFDLDDQNFNLKLEFNGDEILRFDDVPYFFVIKSYTNDHRETNEDQIFEYSKSAPILKTNFEISINFKRKCKLKYDETRGNLYHNNILTASINIEDLSSNAIVKSFNIIELGNYNKGDLNLTQIDYDAEFSHNGQYLAIRSNKKTYVYRTDHWSNIVNFDNTSGEIYWDCNSLYLGIGNNLIPLHLLDHNN